MTAEITIAANAHCKHNSQPNKLMFIGRFNTIHNLVRNYC